ncbi:MAG: hypothetical protein ACE5HW_00240, partial [Candidatus Methanofastidiosia archaeon]
IPLVLYFFYQGIREYLSQFEKKVRRISNLQIFFLFGVMILLSLIIASKAETIWDKRLEIPFIYLTAIPTITISILLIKEARKAYIEYGIIILSVPLLAVATTFQGIIIFTGRYSHIIQNGWLYVSTHALQDIFHSIIGTILIVFTISISHISRDLRKDLLADWFRKLS